MKPDAVVIGGGPAGVSAARPLVEAGWKVLMLDAGRSGLTPPKDRPSLHEIRTKGAPHWSHLIGSERYGARLSGSISPKIRTLAPPWALEDYQSANRIIQKNFEVVGLLMPGGMSNVWGGASPTWEQEDFSGFPFGLQDLAPSYRRIAAHCGISGAPNGAALDIPLQRPLPLSPNMRSLLKRSKLRDRTSPVHITQAQNMVLSEPLHDRLDCNLSTTCFWGCARRSVYSSTFDLEELNQRCNFRFDGGILVTRLMKSESGYRIDYRRLPDGSTGSLQSSLVILAAGTLPSTRLVMMLAPAFAEGRRLQNAPCAAFALLHPHAIGSALSQEGFGLAQLFFRVEDDVFRGHYASGGLYSAEAVSAADLIQNLPLSRRGGLKFVRLLMSALSIGLLYLPGAFSQNTLRLKRDGAMELPFLEVTGGLTADADEAFDVAFRILGRYLRTLGVIIVPGSPKRYLPGAEVHCGATLPMGSFLSAFGEVPEHPELFVVDGAALSAVPARHHTYTMMANADRIAHEILRRGIRRHQE